MGTGLRIDVRRAAAWIAAACAALALVGCASGRSPPGMTGPGPAAVTPSGRPTTLARAAEMNTRSLDSLPVSPFGRQETGWEAYMPLVAAEIGADPVPQGLSFAAALRRWQAAHDLPADGALDAATLGRIRDVRQARRPFLRERTAARAQPGGSPCPDPPDETTLAWTSPAESWGARPNAARPGVLAAWRRMRAAAARDGALESPLSLQVFSAYRSPTYDAARCATEGACDGVRRATCSAHRTGLALDLVLDGVRPVDSTAGADRLRLSRSPAYRWLLANAWRFGFVNYPFEPWHWEWTGEPVQAPRAALPPPAPSAPPPWGPLSPAPADRPAEATDLLPPGLRTDGPR